MDRGASVESLPNQGGEAIPRLLLRDELDSALNVVRERQTEDKEDRNEDVARGSIYILTRLHSFALTEIFSQQRVLW